MRITLADDAVPFREGVANLLREAGFDVVGQARDAGELLTQTASATSMNSATRSARSTRVGSSWTPTIVAMLVGRSRRRNPLDHLSQREMDVLALMAQGRSNQAIANTLFITDKTVEAHVRAIFTKLDLPAAADDHRRILAVLAFLLRDDD